MLGLVSFILETGFRALNAIVATFNVKRWVPNVQRPKLVFA